MSAMDTMEVLVFPLPIKGKKSSSVAFHMTCFICRTEEVPAAQQPAKPQAQANGTGNLGQISASTLTHLGFLHPF